MGESELAQRFVAGDDISDAIEAVRELNADGLKATLDNILNGTLLPEVAESVLARMAEGAQRMARCLQDIVQ